MSSPNMSSPDKLVYMANQIAKFFESQGQEKAVAGTTDHLKKFWDPRMRSQIVAHVKAGGSGLNPVACKAIEQLPEMKTEAPAATPAQ
jgi:formate dehydrogenase subunit delta